MIMGMMPTDDRVNGTNKKAIFSVIFFFIMVVMIVFISGEKKLGRGDIFLLVFWTGRAVRT